MKSIQEKKDHPVCQKYLFKGPKVILDDFVMRNIVEWGSLGPIIPAFLPLVGHPEFLQ
jgi:hypothetical protein